MLVPNLVANLQYSIDESGQVIYKVGEMDLSLYGFILRCSNLRSTSIDYIYRPRRLYTRL